MYSSTKSFLACLCILLHFCFNSVFKTNEQGITLRWHSVCEIVVFLFLRLMSEGSLSSSGQMFMTFGTPTWPSSLIATGARSWRELGIYLNRPSMAALLSLQRVNIFNRVTLRCFVVVLLFSPYLSNLLKHCFYHFSHLSVVCQTGRGVWISTACHGCLWKSNTGCGNWWETPYV